MSKIVYLRGQFSVSLQLTDWVKKIVVSLLPYDSLVEQHAYWTNKLLCCFFFLKLCFSFLLKKHVEISLSPSPEWRSDICLNFSHLGGCLLLATYGVCLDLARHDFKTKVCCISCCKFGSFLVERWGLSLDLLLLF